MTSSMVELPGGAFRMGSERFYPEEAPVREVTVGPFAIDRGPVTVAEFRAFVEETGHTTTAEHAPTAEEYPGADPDLLVAGSLVFRPTEGPVPLHDHLVWWAWMPGADWRHPDGPGSSVEGREDHPVTHVTHADAAAYASWRGAALPTEAEWEYASRGGLADAIFTWGDEFAPEGRMMANTWQGRFPWENLLLDGHAGTSPVGTFPPNSFGLHDMAGNVWEWTDDAWVSSAAGGPSCCVPQHDPEAPFGRKVIKGGSHLCAPNYCLRYRPAARQGQAVDSSTSHIGFRCVVRRGEDPGA
ncbi:MAG TPA: formylglycine-generating enzyme family protein [Miltoncostaea sp.]|nr:formylglycine-generating enzyme family protein [Miltoncostaea sp.]